MAVSTTALNTTNTTTTTTNPLATSTLTTTARKNIKMEPKSLEIFSTVSDAPSAHLTASAMGATAMDAQTLLDEWLANDLQQTGLLAEVADMPSLFSSPSLDGSPGESPLMPTIPGDFELAAEPLFGTPLLGDLSPAFSPPSSANNSPLVSPAKIFENSSILDADMSFFSDLDATMTVAETTTLGALSTKMTDPQAPTAVLVAQLAAAGAFNIPWGTEPATQQVPPHSTDLLQEPAALAAAKAAAEFRKSQAAAAAAPVGSSTAVSQIGSKRKSVDVEDLDPNDEVALKRAKNTDAARRSRMKKVMKMEGLERRVSELESENSKLVLKVAVLESEKAGGEAREQEYERRIKRLEDQLREAHLAVLESRSPKE